MESLFKQEWEAIENDATRPQRLRFVVEVSFSEFRENVLSQDRGFVKETVRSFYAGDVYILRDAYPKDFLLDLRVRVFEWGKKSLSSFYKMLEGVPDFHRIIDSSISKNYSIETVRHTYYFFPWNGDPLQIFDIVNQRWRVLKLIGGFRADEYEQNTPEDGVVDRVVIAHYPPGTGEQEIHWDPYLYQRSIMGTKMSVKGVDYETGGIYFIDMQNKERDLDDELGVGDVYMAYPTVRHGVRKVDPGKETNWEDIRGRWFLGVYSAASDVTQSRHTGCGLSRIKGGK